MSAHYIISAIMMVLTMLVSLRAISSPADSWDEKAETHQHMHACGSLRETYRPDRPQLTCRRRQRRPSDFCDNPARTAYTPVICPSYQSCQQTAQWCCHQDLCSRKLWSVRDL